MSLGSLSRAEPDDVTLNQLLSTNRTVAGAVAALLIVVMIGPFPNLERGLGMNDVAAHALAFYGLSLAAFRCTPLAA